MNQLSKKLLLLIIILSAFLRMFMLGAVPSSPNWDEVSLGYNAYSIMLTGRDEYGAFLPIILRSFDDYKPAAYSYFIIPFLRFTDLNATVVRLPSAFFGILLVFLTYLLVKELFKLSDRTIKNTYVEGISLLSSFLLAISPWHIQFSRVAFESNVGVTLNILALLFFLKGLKNPINLIFSFFFAALSIHTYQSEKVFIPLVMIVLTIIFYKQLFKVKYYYLAGVVVAFIITLPFIYYVLTNPNALMRAKGVSVFSDQTQFLQRNVIKLAQDQQTSSTIGVLLDNRRIEYVKAIFAGYIAHFDLNWLFISGDIARHHAPFMGLLYLFELPFLLIGIYKVVFGDFGTKTKLVIFAYFLIVPIPASITSGVPHAVRTLNFLPFFQIFTAFGILTAFEFLKKYSKVGITYKVFDHRVGLPLSIIMAAYFLFASLNFFYYLNQYFVQQNYYVAADWLYGYRQTIDFIKPTMNQYRKIIVSNKQPLDQSYMFFLYYLKYDPASYQQTGGTLSGGFAENHKGFSNFTFRPIDWGKELKDGDTLFIGPPGDFPEGANILKTIYYPDGKKAISIVQG